MAPAADRDLVRRVVQRVDQILGYPRTLAEGEVTRTGPASRRAPLPTVESAFVVWLHDDTGATQLHGAIAVVVDGVAEQLRERWIEHAGTRKRIREWIADRGWVLRDSLPGVAEAWSRLPHRDGAAGSVDGVPIPEGQE